MVLHRFAAAVLLGVCVAEAAAAAQPSPNPDADTSPHRRSLVTVAPGVDLEVLDWGGRGPELVLLSSFGNTAHVYDDFAERLTRTHRVVAITRRGAGTSSAPAAGYTTRQLVADVLTVMDHLDLVRPVVAGHGAAGYELTWLGTHHPERIRGLVYLDAAYDQAQAPLRQLIATDRPVSGVPGSGTSWRRWFVDAMYGGVTPPNAEMLLCCAAARTPSGSDDRRRVLTALASGVEHAGYRGIAVQSLAMYAPLPASPSDHAAYELLPAADRERFAREYPALVAAHEADMNTYRHTIRGGRAIRLLQANHYLFLSQMDATYHELMMFLQRITPVIE